MSYDKSTLLAGRKDRAVAALGLSAAAAAQETGDPTRGRQVFSQGQACHSLSSGVSGNVGASPAGVVLGESETTVSGYAYLPALSASGGVWDEIALDKRLERPSARVPGMEMIFAGEKTPADRLAIIAYLKRGTP